MSVVMDWPPVVEAEPVEDPLETAPRRKRAWGRLLFPWLKTAIEDDDLLIVNSTDDTWALSLGYHDLAACRRATGRWSAWCARGGCRPARSARPGMRRPSRWP